MQEVLHKPTLCMMFSIFAHMNTAYLILGSNVGNKLENLAIAEKHISVMAGKIIKKSSVYITSAWGNTDQPDFLNQALCIETPYTAPDLLASLLSIEQLLGRVRDAQKWMQRTMDIDILFYNNDIISTRDLEIPHPFIQERKFVLIPLSEIASGLTHPVLKKNIEQLLSGCEDNLKITLLETNGKHTNTI